jgi:YD repeat-containing protein
VSFVCFAVPAPAAVFTTNLTITETNFAHDGQDSELRITKCECRTEMVLSEFVSRNSSFGFSLEGRIVNFAYGARGNVTASTNRRGGVITYAYNSAGQLTNKDHGATPGLTDFTYAYDSAGNLTNATYWNPQLATQETRLPPGGA